jgi:hypothetical protein
MNVSLGDNYTLSHSELHVRPSQLDDTKNNNNSMERKKNKKGPLKRGIKRPGVNERV